jgi:hypothetical protein
MKFWMNEVDRSTEPHRRWSANVRGASTVLTVYEHTPARTLYDFLPDAVRLRTSSPTLSSICPHCAMSSKLPPPTRRLRLRDAPTKAALRRASVGISRGGFV